MSQGRGDGKLLWSNYLSCLIGGEQIEKIGSMYRPRTAKFLTKQPDFVKMMAISDHIFGCYKLQFRTAQDAKELTPMV